MTRQVIIISNVDMDRLSDLVRALKQSLFKDQRQIEVLDQILQAADVVAPDLVPRNVIRMESRFRVQDLNSGRKERYTLVFPEEADISQGRMSILAPVGAALLGHAAGDLVEAQVPGGTRRLQVEQVFCRRPRKRKQNQRSETTVEQSNSGIELTRTGLAA